MPRRVDLAAMVLRLNAGRRPQVNSSRELRASYLVACLVMCGVSASQAQEIEQVSGLLPLTEVPKATAAVTVPQYERTIAELEQSNDVAIDVKLQAIENYKAAIQNLLNADNCDARLKSMSAETETVAKRTDELKRLRSELKDKQPSIESGLALQELEQLLPQTELQLSAFKKGRQDAEVELQTRAPRRKEIRERMSVVTEKIADTQTQLRALSNSEQTIQSASLTARLTTRRLAFEKEIPALEAELARYDAEEAADYVRMRMDLALANAAYSEKMISLLQQTINASREAAAVESVRVARLEVILTAPVLKVYAEENQALAEKAKVIAQSLASTQAELKAALEAYDGIVRQFAQTRKKVDSVGLTSSVGALLRKQQTTLPDVEQRRHSVASRQTLLNDTQYQLFEYEDAYQELGELDAAIDKILSDNQLVETDPNSLLKSTARELLTRKREYLEAIIRSSGQYFDALIELDTTDQQLISLTADYEKYIDQRVLWIRSGPMLSTKLELEPSDSWMLSPAKWRECIKLLNQDARTNWGIYLVSLSAASLLVLRGRSMRRLITQLGATAQKANCRSIVPTLRVLLLSTLMSVRLPLLVLFLGWRLIECSQDSEFASAAGTGSLVTGVLWLSIEWMRQMCRPNGVGESHFRWSTAVTQTFRLELKLLTYVALPLSFVTATLASSEGVHERGDVQRFAFILGMVCVCFTAIRLLRPQGVVREYLSDNQEGWVNKVKHLISLVGASVPLTLAALAAAGYFYTAKTLFWRLFATYMFVVSLILVRSLFYRMLLLKRRALSMEQSRQRASAAAKCAADGSALPQPVAGIVTEDTKVDFTAHSLQSRQLIRSGMLAVSLVGLWMIWIQVLPALSMLGEYPVWGRTRVVSLANVSQTPISLATPASAETPGSSPSSPIVSEQAHDVVTLSHLALAILIIVVTFVVSRNGPGLLEIAVLQQFPIDASVRYAITTLVSYAIVMLGTIAACSTIGLQWSQIQWLATALTFGLAFGLQEMFANFVAGLIILLERPIRVGDVVTVDDVTGVVSRIRIRATSITNWDRKEYVVPNKEFITGRLLNWTLSDNVNRVTVEVGLAYGSDTELARELLTQAANDHPMVLKDPAAMASFQGFGDNSLNMVLRAFLPSLENRLQVIHELHTTIDKSFRKAGLEIAFPQRDLHISTYPAVLGQVISSGESENTLERREAA